MKQAATEQSKALLDHQAPELPPDRAQNRGFPHREDKRSPSITAFLFPSVQSLTQFVQFEFRRRFRQRAAEADLKLNELLREALDAWEQKRGY